MNIFLEIINPFMGHDFSFSGCSSITWTIILRIVLGGQENLLICWKYLNHRVESDKYKAKVTISRCGLSAFFLKRTSLRQASFSRDIWHFQHQANQITMVCKKCKLN